MAVEDGRSEYGMAGIDWLILSLYFVFVAKLRRAPSRHLALDTERAAGQTSITSLDSLRDQVT
jgi:hypothetical protein